MTAGVRETPPAGAPAFELERFAWTDDGRLEVSGRWSGVRGRRFMRPSLDVHGPGLQRRLLADLEHKPWAAEDGEPWIAAFPWDGDPAEVTTAELAVAPAVSVVITPPGARSGRAAKKGPTPADLRRERDAALAERDEARTQRDAALRQRDEAIEARDVAMRGHAAVLRERDAALAERDAALRERDEAIEARDHALRERDAAVADRDAVRRERNELLSRHEAALAGPTSGQLERLRTELAEARTETQAMRRQRDAARAEADAARAERAVRRDRPRPALVWAQRVVAFVTLVTALALALLVARAVV